MRLRRPPVHRLAPPALLAVLAAALLPASAAGQIPREEYASRRATVARAIGDDALVVVGAPEPPQDYVSFFQDPDFLYLTGVREPGAALVLTRGGGGVHGMLFVEPRDPVREVWSGARLGADSAARLTGLVARPIGELPSVLDSLGRAVDTLHVAGAGVNGRSLAAPQGVGGVLAPARSANPKLVVRWAGMPVRAARAFKSGPELDLIRKAVNVTVRAHQDAMRLVEPDLNEFEVQALVEYVFRRNGADRPAFATIAGSGPNATTLHYNRNDRFMRAGETVVLDIGASYGGYSADVTRTLPVSGTFTPEQRLVYQAVRDAQAAAERQARVGVPWKQLADSAALTLGRGLARAGLVDSATATYECAPNRQCAQLALFYMHGLGHGIGLEVHDPDRHEVAGTLGPGSVFTIEPGAYVRANVVDLVPDVPANRAYRDRLRALMPAYANVGVRIEDDYIVTANGLEWLSRGAPREIAEIEAAMAQPWTGPSARSAEMVDWYRRR